MSESSEANNSEQVVVDGMTLEEYKNKISEFNKDIDEVLNKHGVHWQFALYQLSPTVMPSRRNFGAGDELKACFWMNAFMDRERQRYIEGMIDCEKAGRSF